MGYLEAVTTAKTRQLRPEELDELNKSELGLDSHLGVVYSQAGPTEVRAYLDVNSTHLQYAGSVNGGVFCSIAESLASVASMISAQSPCVGVNNSTDFIRGSKTVASKRSQPQFRLASAPSYGTWKCITTKH